MSSKPLSTFVQALVDDPAFLDSIEENSNNIMKDDKVTIAYMPDIFEIKRKITDIFIILINQKNIGK